MVRPTARRQPAGIVDICERNSLAAIEIHAPQFVITTHGQKFPVCIFGYVEQWWSAGGNSMSLQQVPGRNYPNVGSSRASDGSQSLSVSRYVQFRVIPREIVGEPARVPVRERDRPELGTVIAWFVMRDQQSLSTGQPHWPANFIRAGEQLSHATRLHSFQGNGLWIAGIHLKNHGPQLLENA